jgi:hypothetical protein
MKLLRLTTENNKAYFESVFNSDLVIKPYSKIALSSFTTQLNNLNMIIDAQNNEISYTVDGNGNIKTITLPSGTYVSSNIGEFWLETTRLFNASMSNTTNQINRQWFCGVQGGRATFKLLTGTRVAPQSPVSSGLYVTKNLESGGAGAGKLKKTEASGGIGNNAFLYIRSPNNKAVSSLRATFFNEGSPTESGFVLGYTASNPTATTEEINPANYLYGIRYTQFTTPAVPYKYIVNGVEEISVGVFPEEGDILSIDIYNSQIYLRVYRSTTNDVETLYDGFYNHQTNLFPLLLFVGSGTIMNNIQFTSDPYYNINNTYEGEPILQANSNLIIIPTKDNPTNCFLQFNSSDLASILGFNKTRYPSINFLFEAEPQFIAERPFALRDFSESYIIELLNIKLESMCSLSGGQRNFLYVIPQLSAIKEHVVFQVPQLIFLNMNNSTEINLREVRARVLKDDLTDITCYGLSELVIIIKDKDEI